MKPRYLTACIVLLSCLYALIFVARGISVHSAPALAETSGTEATALFGIYRAWAGIPVYEPIGNPTSPAFYNFLFYYGFAFLIRLMTSNVVLLPILARYLNLVFLLLTFLIFSLYLFRTRTWTRFKNQTGLHPAAGPLYLSLMITGPLVGWWAFTGRSDLASHFFEWSAFLIFMSCRKEIRPLTCAGLALLFAVSWGFKQSSVVLLTLTFFTLLFRRKFFSALTLGGLFAAIVLLVFKTGGVPYYENTLVLPRIHGFALSHQLYVTATSLLLGCFAYLPAGLFLLFWAGNRKFREDPSVNLLAVVLPCLLVANSLMSSNIGSSKNYFFESFFAGMLFNLSFSASFWKALSASEKKLARRVLAAAGALSLAVVLSYVNPAGGFAKCRLLSPAAMQNLEELRSAVRNAARPVFIETSFHATPWFTGDPQVQPLEPLVYHDSQRYGLYPPFSDLLEERNYGEAFVVSHDSAQAFREAGYQELSALGTYRRFRRDG